MNSTGWQLIGDSLVFRQSMLLSGDQHAASRVISNNRDDASSNMEKRHMMKDNHEAAQIRDKNT
jgi:hypothetical protein